MPSTFSLAAQQAAAIHLPATYAWAAIILLAVLVYTTLDGFDLGVGMLLPTVKDPVMRHGMTATIAPFWDGNETWLVLAGAGLLAGFPAVYANVLGTLPLPLSLLLVGLILRGTGLEFSHAAVNSTAAARWEIVFSAGSWLASFCIGVAGGLVLQLEPLRGGAANWLDPLPWLAGLGMCWTHALLGAVWLSMKAEGKLSARMTDQARLLLTVMPAWPLVLMLAAAPGSRPPAALAITIWSLSVILMVHLRRRLKHGADTRAFLQLLIGVAIAFLGWAMTLVGVLNRSGDLGWSHLAAPGASVTFALYGSIVLLPCVVGYSLWGYRVFRGRLAGDQGSQL